MKKQKLRTVKKRKREKKTDYKARLKLLKSPLARIAIRKTNRYITAQYITSENAQDKVLVGVNSKDLLKFGWNNTGNLKSLPACYFTGLLLGKKITEKGADKKAVLDLGLARNIKKSRIYSVLKGLTDAEIEIKHKKEILPDDKRIKGEHLKNKIDFEKIKNKINS